MAIQCVITLERDWILVECSGSFVRDSWLKMYEDSFASAHENGRIAVLVDGRNVEGPGPSMLERFEVGVAIAEIQGRYAERIGLAVVGSEKAIFEPTKFGETVALNRGAIGGMFDDFEEAVAWLRDWVEKSNNSPNSQ